MSEWEEIKMSKLYVACIVVALLALSVSAAVALDPVQAECGLLLEILPYASIANVGEEPTTLVATADQGAGTYDFHIYSYIEIQCNTNWNATIHLDQELTNADLDTIEVWLVESRFDLNWQGGDPVWSTDFIEMSLAPIPLITNALPGKIIILDHQIVTVNLQHPPGTYTANEVYTLTPL